MGNDAVIKYYDVAEIDYKLVWDLKRSKSIHYGFWDKTTWSFRQALQRINSVLAEIAKITKKDKVLDAGCGVGGSSIWLARNIGCKVSGITISAKQAETAKNYASEEDLKSVDFQEGDYLNTDFKSNSFDVVWALESVCYAKEKKDFLIESKRVLKKKGRLIMSDFFKVKQNLSEDELVNYREWANGWALKDFELISDFKRKLKLLGFKNIIVKDATKNVWPLARRQYAAFFVAFLVRKFLYLFQGKNEILEKNLWAAYHQYQALKKGVWKYYIVYAKND